MKSEYVRLALLLTLAFLNGFSISDLSAQEMTTAPATRASIEAIARPAAAAVRAAEPLVIDGRLSEEAWQRATPMNNFIQAEPLEGLPASEETEVRLLYDNTAIYIGVRLSDSDPSQIITTDTSRDAGLNDQDSFQIIFDTYRDRQNGFVFGTNAAGIQFDAQVRNQGNPNSSWDGSWEVVTQQGENGWTAEFRIPLRTLRYGASPQVWGVNFMRNIQRRRERTYWAPLPRQFNLSRLSSAGELRGLQLPTPRNLKILPYVVASANRDFRPGLKTDYDRNAGADLKLGITGSLNLDLTYNTDFAQVEVDTQQINLTRYNIRFPERRPFFLENAQLFAVGASGGGFGGSGDVALFFSRRIGLDEDGTLVPIKGGARLSGKAGGYNIGLLNIQTEDVLQNPGNNFTTLRVSRELPNRSGLGAIFVNRSATGDLAGADNWNRTWGLDGRLGVGERVSVGGFAAKTETPGLTGRDYAWNMTSDYDDGKTLVNFDYGIKGEDFNPEVGYVENTLGYRRWYFRAQETMRQQKIRGWGFREFQPHINYTRYDYLDGQGMQNADLHVDNHWDWEDGYFISTAMNGTWEGLDRPFQIYPGIVVPPGRHGGLRYTMRSNTDRRKWLFLRHQWDVGTFLNGDQNSHTFQTTIRQGGTFALDTTWNYRSIKLPQGSFRTNLGNMRLTYNFTPTVFAQSLLQYNDRTQRFSMNLRFHWLWTAGTGLFVVYNDTESMDGMGPVNRAFIVKYVRQFDILR
ncbi:MAG: carbohydrate binding family 9 domain-containing protein [Acidobacteria bacterium]|nr:carbohydrate binding family 9 domain-containing protein [Acidobacteriota bacterium]